MHRDEPVLYDLEKAAFAQGVPLEVVIGSAPGWEEPWSRARSAHVEPGVNALQYWLVDDHGSIIDELDVQRARLSTTSAVPRDSAARSVARFKRTALLH